MKVLGSYLRKNAGWLCIDVLGLAIAFLIIYFNDVPMSEWVYGAAVCVFLLLTIGGVDFFKYLRKHKRLCELEKMIGISLDALEEPKDVWEEDYQKLLQIVEKEKNQEINSLKNDKRDMMEYYTMWIHQIKTPIAAMRLLLQSEDTKEHRELSEELFHMEQYVKMALGYMRLNTDATDYVFGQIELDDIVKEAVRRYAKLFVRKKIGLDYTGLHTTVLTDEKWLEFVIEQLLSNALKYTANGRISIYMQEGAEAVLVIEDTGIGIRSEDLPRICEKGYTGYNGHTDKRSTGIGLYLCKRILEKLGHSLKIESTVGKGTRVLVGLSTRECKWE